MAEFKIKGKPTEVGMREFRALLRAADCVLRMMGLHPSKPTLNIILVPSKKLGEDTGGVAFRSHDAVFVGNELSFSVMATIVIHELFHIYSGEGVFDNEWITSTTASRIKDDVIQIANFLMANSQRYAAFKAHQKIAYLKGDPSEYNDAQFHEGHAKSAGEKFRRHGK